MAGLANREAAIQGRNMKRIEDVIERLERLAAGMDLPDKGTVPPPQQPLSPFPDYGSYYDEREGH